MIIYWKSRLSHRHNCMKKAKQPPTKCYYWNIWSHCWWEKVAIPPKSGVTVLVTNLGPDPRGQTTAFRLKANPNPFVCQDLILQVKILSAFLAMQVINTGTAYHKPDNYSSSPCLWKKPPRAQCHEFFFHARRNNERRARLLYWGLLYHKPESSVFQWFSGFLHFLRGKI